MDERALDALTMIELREAELLSWGAVGAEWTQDELLKLLSDAGAGQAVLDELITGMLVVRTPGGGYRSRSAETVRLLATLRQAFREKRVTDGQPLILDHRFLHRPRRRPRRDIPADQVLTGLGTRLGESGLTAVRRLMPANLSAFQQRSTNAVLDALDSRHPAGVMVTAGTGSGKTLAFYLPLLSWLADQSAANRQNQTRVLALYPRNELLKDQLRALLEYVTTLAEAGGREASGLSLSTWFGSTPATAEYVRKNWADGWIKKGRDFVCPYLRCLKCDSDLVWREADLAAKPSARERLECVDASCGAEIDGSVLRLTRESARAKPADLMLTTTESLNRQLSTPGNLVAFGIRPATLTAILLDEVHIYEGTTGAQNAILFRRLRHALGHMPVWVGLSATLRNAGEFFARLVALPAEAVTVVRPELDELEESGAEYLMALRHDPYTPTGPLSATIQTCMALARCLDHPENDPFDPAPSSDGVFGSKVFVFTDKLDSTNRLYWNLSDAEGLTGPKRRKPVTLAHLRSQTQSRLVAANIEPAADRDADGQWWWLSEQLGHGLDADRSLRVGRTSSQDRGVETEAQVIVATATLEVGFDDDRVGAVVQHKAPHDSAQFLQRKGRAGRNPLTRPWTVVVLSDWGRDRHAWDTYHELFDPDLPPRSLPVDNVYVLRIQAVYALLDWLAAELGYTGRDSTWSDLAGPAHALFPDKPKNQDAVRERQRALSTRLGQLLRPGPERNRLRRHLRDALGLGSDEAAESTVDTLLWDAPRPLMLAVVPTMRRRLQDQWTGEEPLDGDTGLRTRTPLRDFVPGNLFDDLLVPDVELRMPTRKGKTEVEHLPALRALREFCPGNVSRHFGVYEENKRHWIPLPTSTDEVLRVDVMDTYRAEAVDTVDVGFESVTVYTPIATTLEAVPETVRDASSISPDWEFHATALGAGSVVHLARGSEQLLGNVTAHLHSQGGGARTIRFARTAQGTMWDPHARPARLQFGVGSASDWIPAAVGVDVHCDAIEARVRMPEQLGMPTPAERSERLQHVVTTEADLPDTMSVFHRARLCDVLKLAIASEPRDGLQSDGDAEWATRLQAAATTLGILSEEQQQVWEDWFKDSQVLAAVRRAVDEVRADDRSTSWESWWRRTFTFSAANVALSALSALCPGVDTDDVAIDIDSADVTKFWLTEPSPGGTGQVEAFLGALTHDPEGFTRAMEDALTPSAVETVDEELTALVRSGQPRLRAALDDLRAAWRQGHVAVSEAVRRVDDTAREQGIALRGPARSALSTRIAGPGAHRDLIDTVVSWLSLRDRVGELSGVQVDPRTLGALLADDSSLDAVLQLGEQVTPPQRARAVSNVLWPWGQSSHGAKAAGYVQGLHVSLAAVRSHVALGPEVIDVTPWDDERREAIHQTLRDYGEVVLRVRLPDGPALKTVLLDLQTRPVEVGALFCHPIITGMRTTAHAVEARVLLREAS